MERRIGTDWLAPGLQLLDAELQYRALIRDNPDAVYTIDPSGVFVAANDSAFRLSGYSAEEFVGMHFDDLLADSCRGNVQGCFAACLQGKARHFDAHLIRKDGASIYIAVSLFPSSSEGAVQGVVGISRDVTDRVLTEQARASSEECYRGLFQHSLNGILLFDNADRVIAANPAACRKSRYTQAELIGRPRWSLLRMTQSWSLTETARSDGLLLCSDGQTLWVDVSQFEVPAPNGSFHRCVTVRDVTRHGQARAELAQSREDLRRLLISLHAAQEEERGRLSRKLHDELGQCLTGLHSDISWLRSQPALQSGSELDGKLGAMAAAVEQTLESVQRMARNLRPTALDELGLGTACKRLVEDVAERTGLDCHIESSVDGIPLPTAVATTAFRIVEEALTNACKHSGAPRVVVRLHTRHGKLLVSVADSGCGMKPGGTTNGLGLLDMHERVHALGGEIALESEGKGLCVRVHLPIESETCETRQSASRYHLASGGQDHVLETQPREERR